MKKGRGATFAAQVGQIRIDRIVESENADIDPTHFFPGTTPADWERHRPWLQPRAMHPETGKLILPIQSYLLRTPAHTIVVDACVGNGKTRERPHWHLRDDPAYLEGLRAAGVAPEEVDYVFCTHLHADHVGWNTRLEGGRWVPTFPNARYVLGRRELAFWEARHAASPLPHLADSVLPVVAAGQATLADEGFALEHTVFLEPTPGHTPHHASVRLASGGEEAVLTGDVMHSPAQCAEPDWHVLPDWHPEMARRTRRAFLERYCDTGVLVCTAHFPSPSIGHIHRSGEGFRFHFLGQGGSSI